MRALTRDEFVGMASRLSNPELAEGFTEPSTAWGVRISPFFLELSGAVVSLIFDPARQLFWVGGVAGRGLGWMRELAGIARVMKYRYIGFKTKPERSWTMAFVRYSKARLMAETPSGNEYCFDLNDRFPER